MRNRPILQMVVIGVIACVIAIPLALIVPWFPSDASRQAGNVRTLYDVLLIASVPIFVLVETVVLFSVWKFRMRPGQEEMDGPPIHGNTRLEVAWTAVPAILIVSLCTYAYTVLRSNEDSKRNEMTINVTARQFAFEFSYPEAGGKTVVSPVLYLAKDQPVVFKLHALDVIHSFFVPNFSEKLDAVPGITTTLRVTPTRLGSYPAECTELCGAGHSLMRAPVRVVTPAAFQAWLRPRSPIRPAGRHPAAERGRGGDPRRRHRGAEHVVVELELVHEPRRRKGRVHGFGGLQLVSHAGGRRRDRHSRAQPGHGGCAQCQEGRHGAQAVHNAVNREAQRVHLPRFRPNVMPQTFSQTLTSSQIQALVNFIASVTK